LSLIAGRASFVVLLLCGVLPFLATQPASNPSPAPDSTDTEQALKDIDSIFDADPPPTASPVATGTPEHQTEPIKPSMIKFFGSTTADLGFMFGWTDWPRSDDFSMYLKYVGGVQAKTALGIDVRPGGAFHTRAHLSVAYPNPALKIEELYADYALLDQVFFKLGVFGFSQGYARIFTLADISARVAAGKTKGTEFTLKAAVPLGLGGVTAIVKARDDYFASPGSPSPTEAGYGLQFDLVTGPLEWNLAGFYQKDLSARGMIGCKTAVASLDVFAELVLASWGTGASQQVFPSVAAGVYYEPETWIRVYGEYAYNGERPAKVALVPDASSLRGHNSMIGVRLKASGSGNFRFSFAWQQNYTDGSAFITPLFEIDPLPAFTAQLGLPIRINDPYTEYLEQTPITDSLRVSCAFLLRAKFDYADE